MKEPKGTITDEVPPSRTIDPASTSLHIFCPGFSCKYPCGQVLHPVELNSLAYNPGIQERQIVLPRSD